jgi:stress-induced-phosphoprotein 1
VKYQKYWKNINKSERLKNDAAEQFKEGNIEEALALYEECLQCDPLFNTFNTTILYNKASGLVKINKTDEALLTLDRAIAMNKEYVKAYFKKGDILLGLMKYDEAIFEYNKVKEIGGP